MRYVIAYDIEDDRIRTRVARILRGFGEAVQRSVFECTIKNEADLQLLVRRLEREIARDPQGNVRAYRLCLDCRRSSLGIGKLKPTADSDVCITV